jgi:hypothetical protein
MAAATVVPADLLGLGNGKLGGILDHHAVGGRSRRWRAGGKSDSRSGYDRNQDCAHSALSPIFLRRAKTILGRLVRKGFVNRHTVAAVAGWATDDSAGSTTDVSQGTRRFGG